MMKRLLISLLLVGTALPAVAQHVARPSGESPIRPAKTSQVQPATRESELEPQVGEAEMREAQVRRLEAEELVETTPYIGARVAPVAE